jgi:NitT/TauT family transport system ATP-binding protein
VTLLFVTHDIDEAVYLGQRVIMLSAAPTRVAEDLMIDLPDERDQLATRGGSRFTELRGRVYAQIQRAKRGAADAPQPNGGGVTTPQADPATQPAGGVRSTRE